ncbi:putative Predicted protein [Agrobacterium fabacearum S56]|uniref:hypothetical protein n=1 Tax=Agrobacterium tumefaciens TaxID=358 RepID=UPI0009BBF54D|nr:hypothetical protein [Agrobacterium tumefaciens]CUW90209.1 putative Predicted protein [Agrobacterium fabacearum S56]
MITENPAALAGAKPGFNINAFTGLDAWNPTESTPENQSELLAVKSVMRRCRVSFWHAKTICQLHGLGGLAA